MPAYLELCWHQGYCSLHHELQHYSQHGIEQVCKLLVGSNMEVVRVQSAHASWILLLSWDVDMGAGKVRGVLWNGSMHLLMSGELYRRAEDEDTCLPKVLEQLSLSSESLVTKFQAICCNFHASHSSLPILHSFAFARGNGLQQLLELCLVSTIWGLLELLQRPTFNNNSISSCDMVIPLFIL